MTFASFACMWDWKSLSGWFLWPVCWGMSALMCNNARLIYTVFLIVQFPISLLSLADIHSNSYKTSLARPSFPWTSQRSHFNKLQKLHVLFVQSTYTSAKVSYALIPWTLALPAAHECESAGGPLQLFVLLVFKLQTDEWRPLHVCSRCWPPYIAMVPVSCVFLVWFWLCKEIGAPGGDISEKVCFKCVTSKHT